MCTIAFEPSSVVQVAAGPLDTRKQISSWVFCVVGLMRCLRSSIVHKGVSTRLRRMTFSPPETQRGPGAVTKPKTMPSS